MRQCMAKRSIKAKYRETAKVNYRKEDDITNIPLTCTSIECNEYRTSHDGQIDTSRHKQTVGIQYRHESKEDIEGFIPKLVARQYINIKVCYYKTSIADTYIFLLNYLIYEI